MSEGSSRPFIAFVLCALTASCFQYKQASYPPDSSACTSAVRRSTTGSGMMIAGALVAGTGGVMLVSTDSRDGSDAVANQRATAGAVGLVGVGIAILGASLSSSATTDLIIEGCGTPRHPKASTGDTTSETAVPSTSVPEEPVTPPAPTPKSKKK